MSKTYNIFEDRDGLFYPLAVNVSDDYLGDGLEDAFVAVELKGFARVGGGAQPIFHIERCWNARETLDDVTPRYEVESLTAFA